MSVIVVPKLGLTIEEVEIIEWHVTLGEEVEPGQALVSVNADKTEVEIEAETAGSLTSISAEPGQIVKVGTVIGHFDDGSAPLSEQRLRCSPLARRLAKERQIDLKELVGTGPAGRIVARDVPFADATLPRREAQAGSAATGQPIRCLRASVDAAEAIGVLHTPQATATGTTLSHLLVWAWLIAVEAVIAPPFEVGFARQPNCHDLGVLPNLDELRLAKVSKAIIAAQPAPAGRGPIFALLDLSESALPEINGPLPAGVAALAAVGTLGRKETKRHGQSIMRPRLPFSLSYDTQQLKGSVAAELLRCFANQASAAGDLLAELNAFQ
jgi:multidrug efflux pump subunit AcrA (membrane-fusion protein)